jgi:hypothetical protein
MNSDYYGFCEAINKRASLIRVRKAFLDQSPLKAPRTVENL